MANESGERPITVKFPVIPQSDTNQNPWRVITDKDRPDLSRHQVWLGKEEAFIREKSPQMRLDEVRSRLRQLSDGSSGGSTELGAQKSINRTEKEGKVDKAFLRDSSWQERTGQRKSVVENAYKAGKIDERLREKYEAHIETDQHDTERILNFTNPSFEGFTPEETVRIQSVLKMLPPELLVHLKKIKVMPVNKWGAMRYFNNLKFREGVVEIKKEAFDYDRDVMERKILHEAGGHGLTDMIFSLDREAGKHVLSLWQKTLRQYPDLLLKDSYSRGIVDGSYYNDYDRWFGIIRASEDEFWSDRMAEYWFEKYMMKKQSNQRVSSNRMETAPFTREEEEAVRYVCAQTEFLFRQVLEMHHLNLSPILPILTEKIGQM